MPTLLGRATSLAAFPRTSLSARLLAAAVVAIFVVPSGLLQPKPAAAYLVCDLRCPHEYMSDIALLLFPDGETANHFSEIQAGITHEDAFDHVFGLNVDIPLIGQPLVTATHFWDADLGPEAPATDAEPFGEFQNSWQKVRALWLLALGAYAKGDKPLAYHYLGHIVHHFGDNTVPAHVHDDPHGPEPIDDDSFHDWMDVMGNPPPNARVTPAEIDALSAAGGPLVAPASEPDKLLYLLYETNQIADFFASDDYDGDTVAAGYPGDPAAAAVVQGELNALAAIPGLTRLQDEDEFDNNDDDDDNDDGDLGVVRQYSYLHGIRSIAGLYKLFSETVHHQVSLAVVIDHVEEDQDHDYLCIPNPIPFADDICFETTDPDFYARVGIGNRESRNRGEQVENDEVIDPGWWFANPVGTAGSVPVHVEIWDHDGAYDDIITLADADDQSDIDNSGGGGDKALDLTVDLGKCLRREPGAITGDITAACGDTLSEAGDRDVEASLVRFRVFMTNSPPVADADGPYSTPEGTNIELNGSGSTDPDNDITTYAWDLDGDGACDDVANDQTPDFTAVGQDGTTTVKLCVTDATGLTDEDTEAVVVTNVQPTNDGTLTGAKTENTTVALSGTLTDPGWLDTLSGTVDWGDGSTVQALSGTLENVRPNATLSYSNSHVYGDNGTWTVKVCWKDDDTAPCVDLPVTITNTPPTATIDLSGAVNVNGTPTIIAHAGQAVAFSARSTDPGSDDLTLVWAWGDGTPSSTTLSKVNPPNADPPQSPSIQPRDVTLPLSHTFAGACAYQTSFTATDDDGGSATQTASVIIVGNGHPNQPHGYWKQQIRPYATGKGKSDFTSERMQCYLNIAGVMSRVFSEQTAASTFVQAADVLDVSDAGGDMKQLFDLQLLAVWLDFANGAMEWNRLVDTNGDKVVDTRFLDAVSAAETLRLNPNATRTQLDNQKAIIEKWTSMP